MKTIKIEANTKPANFKKKKFPNGMDPDDYKKCMSWSYRKWAWEFLCRNIEFRNASDKAVNGTEKDRTLVAKKYGLVKFKYYEEVQTNKSIYPTFKDGAIKCRENLSSESKEEKINVAPGQIVIRFKLTAKSNVQQSLDAQIKKAKAKLKKKADEFHKLLNQKIGSKNPKANLFPTYLRILDMQVQGLNTKEIIRSLNSLPPESTTKYSDIENIDSIIRGTQRYIESAEECASTLYRYIALRPNKK